MSEDIQNPSNENISGGNGERDGSSAFSIGKDIVSRAVDYVNIMSSDWVLEPMQIIVEQPPNQYEIIKNLSTLLGDSFDKEKGKAALESNLEWIAKVQKNNSGITFSKLIINPSMNAEDTFISKNIDDNPKVNRDPMRLVVSGPEDVNIMVAGILEVTGAELLRSDENEDGRVDRIYKGMLGGLPVYFEENIDLRKIYTKDKKEPARKYLQKTFSVITEVAARERLNSLSKEDVKILKTLGVEVPSIYSHEYDARTYPNRKRMKELVELYKKFNS